MWHEESDRFPRWASRGGWESNPCLVCPWNATLSRRMRWLLCASWVYIEVVFLYVLWLGSRRSACSPRGTRPEIWSPTDVRKLGRTATGETHSSYQNEVFMKWHSVCNCSAVYELNRTGWPGASWTGKNCTAGLRADGSEPMWQRIPQFFPFAAFPFWIFVSVWIERPSRISRRHARLPRWWSRKCLSISLTSKRPTRLPHGFPTVSRQKTWRNR